jgi:hypothetical protein
LKVYKKNSAVDGFMRNPVSKRNGKDLRQVEGDANMDAGFKGLATGNKDV